MTKEQTAASILELIGGQENIVSAAHCATRLRLVLKDESLANKEEIEKLDLVKGVFSTGGQFQIIIGQGIVNGVYAELANLAGIKEMSTSEVKEAAKDNQKMNPFQKLARTLSNIFVPIIPAIVAAGLLMGLLGAATKFGLDVYADSWWFMMLDMFSSAAFIFLPILVAISAAKEFGANPYLAATVGGIMIHPDLQNAWTSGEGYETLKVFGVIDMPLLGYQGTVLPILLVIFIMAFLEKRIRKIVPNILDILLTPLLTVLITGFLALAVIGPLANTVGQGISWFLAYALENFGLFAGLIFGGSYSSIVVTGIHHSFHAVELGLISDTGVNTLLPIWSMANLAQGGAAFAVYFMTKNAKTKSIALPSAISCLFGITEAAIFGVNIRYGRPFIGAAIGGAVAGAYVVFTKVAMTAVGVTGVPAITITTADSMLNYVIAMVIALVVSFIATWILGIKEDK
ncbi:MAG TPA: PTS sucrose transporter subunit IIBC [Firmicutes bacterium]|nr:PTS sucrose transporter subunit IIBC [Bacillota bacterium]